MAILNCLLARQLCFEDASCSAILEIIPRVCGSELVACSTVTVMKCQAALKTLQAFPFFKPTCLCREPNVDPECNSFRDFLFDHPCMFVGLKEKDPYPVETLPLCTYAHAVCHANDDCKELYEDFKNSCKVHKGECFMANRQACRDAYVKMRLTPLFGCICPTFITLAMGSRCDRYFASVHNNPCIGESPSKVRALFEGPRGPPQNGPPFMYYASPDGTILLLTEKGTRLMTRAAAASLLRDALLSPSSLGPHHERIGKENGKSGDVKVAMQSTCHVALDACIKNSECVTSLTPVLQKCHSTGCNKEGCMAALRGFYGKTGVHWTTEIAFCLCRKTGNREDSCMNAQERLHPSCAQRPNKEELMPTCHTLAHACREESECRTRLEQYEQWCAIDVLTQGCAGAPEACRTAVVAILGTDLRAACVCRGADIAQMQECLSWQRLLWLNTCVVESQRDYHVKTYGSLLTTTPYDNGIRYITGPPETSIQHRTTSHHHRPTTSHEAPEVDQMQENRAELNPITTMSEQTVIPNEVAQISEPVIETTTETTTAATIRTTTTTTIKTTTTTTTTKAPTTLEPTKYCIVKKPDSDDQAQYIKMGETRRLYRSAELAECTDLCVCEASLQVACKVACVPRAPCSSRLAHYSHAAPAYQAYRGRCYCYSGSFICMRPNPGEYKLPEGVYLLLGFSAVDEALLRPHTGLGAEDAVRLLQRYLQRLHPPATNCTLTLYNISNENVIISASVPPREQEAIREAGEVLLDREKEECIDVLKIVKGRINSQHEDISSHLLLSIFKIAEVDVVYPTPPSSAITSHRPVVLFYVIIIIITFIYDSNFTLDNLIFITTILFKGFVNFLSNLFNTKLSKGFTVPVLEVVPFERYFFKNISFLTIFKCYDEFIDKYSVVVVNWHDALALDNAQMKPNTDDVVLSEIYVHNYKEMKHIIKAVSITIFNNFNELVANAIILKYFSRDVYYQIGCNYYDSTKLFGDFILGNIASFSYGIGKSTSLGLTLEVA